MPGSNTNTPPKKYPAQVFSREDIFCPHCQQQLEPQETSCPGCGFNLGECVRLFPFAAPPLSLIIDPSRFLPERITKDLKKPYRKLRKCAPQVDICFCFVRLPEGSQLAEFAFWLHNTAPEADASRAWQLLIVGDLNSGQLTLTSGYALEPFLRRDLWEAALQELAACFSDEQWKEGLIGFLKDTRGLLSAAWQEAARNSKRHLQVTRSETRPGKWQGQKTMGKRSLESDALPSGAAPSNLQQTPPEARQRLQKEPTPSAR